MAPLARVQRLAQFQLLIAMLVVVAGIGANPRLLRLAGFWLIPALLNYYVSRTGNLRLFAIMLNFVGAFFSGIIAISFLNAPFSNSIRITGMILSLGYAVLWFASIALIGLLPRDAGRTPMYRSEDERME